MHNLEDGRIFQIFDNESVCVFETNGEENYYFAMPNAAVKCLKDPTIIKVCSQSGCL